MEGETVHVLFETIPECHCGAAFNGFREAYDHITTETIARLSADRERALTALERLLRDIEGRIYRDEPRLYEDIDAARAVLADLRGEGR